MSTTVTTRGLYRSCLTPRGDGTWDVRIEYLDDNTEDRQGGFRNRADAHGWVQTRTIRHFRLGVPGRLGPGA